MQYRIADIKPRIDLRTQVIEPDIGPAQKRGTRYYWHCPFHADHTPSLVLNPDGQSFRCFSCDSRGDAIDWLVKRSGWDIQQALSHLAGIAGAPTTPTHPGTQSPNGVSGAKSQGPDWHTPPQDWQVKAAAFVDYCAQRLWKTPQALTVLESWGLQESTLREWQIGWSDGGTYSRGIVIPHFAGSNLCAVKIRRFEKWSPSTKPKYSQLAGGAVRIVRSAASACRWPAASPVGRGEGLPARLAGTSGSRRRGDGGWRKQNASSDAASIPTPILAYPRRV